jgi:hypothetical protein
MQGSEFNDYINHFPLFKNHFKGVFAIDTLPKRLGFRKFLICNTDLHTGEGKHWISFFQTEKTTIEVFDSLGIDHSKKELLKTHCKFNNQLIFNLTPFQDSESSSCGLFALYFCIERMFNLDLDFDDILEMIFVTDTKQNEKVVSEFKNEILNN